jgi:dipeptidyl aminopeptidase/acylaminoacyl peptidase
MSSEQVRFFSHGCALAGTLLLPDGASADTPVPAVAQGPGWLGLRDAKLYKPYHEALLAGGIGILVFDYRGFGGSEGDATYLDPMTQVADWRNAISYLETRPEVDAHRLGVFGSGGTGGGNAVAVAGLDTRVRATVAQNPIADGRDWMRRMRRAEEWYAYLERLRVDRLRRVTTGESELVSPRTDIQIAVGELKSSGVKSDLASREATGVALSSADAVMDYRPIDLVGRIAPRALMLVCVEDDPVTPEDHAYQLYERAGGPKRLVVQTQTTHYAAYAQYQPLVNPMIVEWFQRHLAPTEVLVHEQPDAGIVRLTRPTS